MGFWFRDVRDALRHWLRAPMTTSVALTLLGVAMGAHMGIASLAMALYVKPLPVTEAARLGRVVSGRGEYTVQTSVWEYFRKEQAIFESVAAAAPARLNLASAGESRFVQALFTSGEFFDVVGVPLMRGRGLRPSDDRDGATPTALVSYAFWQRDLGGREDVIGLAIDIERLTAVVIGVTAPEFFGIEVGRRTDLYLPIAVEPLIAESRQPASPPHWLHLFARLHPGQTVEQATAALRAWQPALRESTRPPSAPPGQHLAEPLEVISSRTGISFLRQELGQPLLLLLGSVGFVLVMACANLAALMLAQFTDRQREFQIRRALGASGTQIARRLLTETLLLAAAGAVIGTVVATWLTQLMVPWLASPLDRGVVPYLDLRIDQHFLLVTGILILAAGLLAGLGPAIAAALGSQTDTLMPASVAKSGRRRVSPVLYALAAAQVALSLVLVSTAAVLGRSFVALTSQPTAVDGDRVLLASVNGPLFGADASTTLTRIDGLLARLEALPDVGAASASTLTPLSGWIMLTPLSVPGFDSADGRDASVAVNRVTGRFFEVFGTPLLAGRTFDERDHASSPPVAVVNTAFAEHYFGGVDDVVGRMVRMSGRDTEVVGVVSTGRYMNLREPERSFAYVPLAQFIGPRPQPVRFAARSASPDELRPLFVQAVRRFDPTLTLEFRTLADEILAQSNPERLLASLGGVFALLALIMAAVGLYGAFTHMVVRRTREFGVRMALGADRAAILRLVATEAALVLGIGVVGGLACTVASGRLLGALLFGVQPSDPAMLIAALVVVTIVAGLATYLPAHRGARSDPAHSLRSE
jgi:predicted permease